MTQAEGVDLGDGCLRAGRICWMAHKSGLGLMELQKAKQDEEQGTGRSRSAANGDPGTFKRGSGPTAPVAGRDRAS